MKELSKEENKPNDVAEETSFETPKSIALMKTQWAKFQSFTKKQASDNIWLIGLKLLLKGFMILILILLSPFILAILIFSLLVAL